MTAPKDVDPKAEHIGPAAPGCICLKYGHGMLLTRVHNYGCPAHGDKTTTPELQKTPIAELEARVEEWVRNG